MGYSQDELDDVQARWNLRFPPDLVDLLREHRPLMGGFDWISSDPAIIENCLRWPFEGFCFDLEHNDLWWPEWGEKPPDLRQQRERLAEIFSGAPKLIPLFSHRYI